MKKSFIGSLIGIAIVVAADTIIRVIFSIALDFEISLFRYNIYPGILWELLICSLTLLTSFLGGVFTVTYADLRKQTGLIIFGVWLMGVRYGQIHYAMEQELLLPIVALILSLGALIIVWKTFLKNKKSVLEEPAESGSHDRRHHSANISES